MPAAPSELVFLMFAGSRDAAAAPCGAGRSGNSRQRNTEKKQIKTENELGNGMVKWLSMASFPAWHPDEISKYAENIGAWGGFPFLFISVGEADSFLVLQLSYEKPGHPFPAWIPLQPLEELDKSASPC